MRETAADLDEWHGGAVMFGHLWGHEGPQLSKQRWWRGQSFGKLKNIICVAYATRRGAVASRSHIAMSTDA